ncbi:Hypothetical_protein [Hexamita inflata]|uniref:Hypothetical_protein n=1 Tax=Hexamita inflata TaxID=28002 RepID=A0AA86QEU6_9EUKA|nr:Hypothetical protein HINF_LOCUS38155 [Hexamita inflata]
MSEVKRNTKKKSIQDPFKIVMKTNSKQITSKTASTLGRVPFVPKSLDFARNIAGQILPPPVLLNQFRRYACNTSGLFQLYITDSSDDCGYDEVVGDDIVIRFLKPEQLLEEFKDMSTTKQKIRG